VASETLNLTQPLIDGTVACVQKQKWSCVIYYTMYCSHASVVEMRTPAQKPQVWVLVWAVASWVGISWNGEIMGFKVVFETVEWWWSFNGKRYLVPGAAEENAQWLDLVYLCCIETVLSDLLVGGVCVPAAGDGVCQIDTCTRTKHLPPWTAGKLPLTTSHWNTHYLLSLSHCVCVYHVSSLDSFLFLFFVTKIVQMHCLWGHTFCVI